MELFLSRLEIRRRMMARLGMTTDGSQAPQVQEQYDEFIRSAAETVYLRCPWAQAQRESRADVGIDQRTLNYPANCGPGEVVQIGLWSETELRFIPLRRGRITQEYDDEPLVEEGEPASIDGRGQPELYELKTQIEIWPRPDQAYRLKIDHTVNPSLATDSDVSTVDAEAIILWAMADAYDFQGDRDLAGIQRGKFEERIRRLIAGQHPLTTVRRGALDRLLVSGRRMPEYVPDSGLWPSRMES